MLKIYADAVKKMKDPQQTTEGDPRSWLFQWYTHFVNDETTKEDELARLFQKKDDPRRKAAEAMWNTCQAHSPDQNEDFFLPWHRCFIYYFEQIIAAVSGEPQFTLPYWNYSASDPTIRGVIPPEFTKENDPVYGPLFEGLRKKAVNDGEPIHKGRPGDPLGLSALQETSYGPNGAAAGFNQALDFGLHGAVHVLVGGTKNMGKVPTAARDPIFWLHHCNIDRLWASWNAAGNANPPLDQKFAFADGKGNAVTPNIADFLDLDKLDYTYDRFEPVPGAVPAAKTAKAVRESVAGVGSQERVKLGATATRVTLAPAPQVGSVAERVARVPGGKRIYLVASDLGAKAQPGVLYSLYLDLPDKPTAQQREDHLVGTINFFGFAHGDGHGGAKPHDLPKGEARLKFVSFDVTGKARALGKNRVLKDSPVLTIIPEGQPAEAAQPVIGKIELVIQ
jgi:tyrosinase